MMLILLTACRLARKLHDAMRARQTLTQLEFQHVQCQEQLHASYAPCVHGQERPSKHAAQHPGNSVGHMPPGLKNRRTRCGSAQSGHHPGNQPNSASRNSGIRLPHMHALAAVKLPQHGYRGPFRCKRPPSQRRPAPYLSARDTDLQRILATPCSEPRPTLKSVSMERYQRWQARQPQRVIMPNGGKRTSARQAGIRKPNRRPAAKPAVVPWSEELALLSKVLFAGVQESSPGCAHLAGAADSSGTAAAGEGGSQPQRGYRAVQHQREQMWRLGAIPQPSFNTSWAPEVYGAGRLHALGIDRHSVGLPARRVDMVGSKARRSKELLQDSSAGVAAARVRGASTNVVPCRQR